MGNCPNKGIVTVQYLQLKKIEQSQISPSSASGLVCAFGIDREGLIWQIQPIQ
jgi:hypothetical protein